MKTILRALALVALFIPTAFIPGAAHADGVTVVKAWARATPGHAPNGAAYLTLKNDTAHEDRLLSAASPVAKVVQLHVHLMKNGMMEMRQVPFIKVPAHGTQTLKPGGYHVMMIGLKAPLKKGTTFPLTLTFKSAGTMTVQVPVEGVGAMTDTMGPMKMKMK